MNTKTKHGCRRMLAMLLVIVSVMSLFAVPAFAGQEDGYHDPAERWMNASNRTNELDVNATVTHETFHCYACGQATSFQVWRTPEYTKDGQTAMTRNVRYSDGTLISGTGTGTILDGTPGVNATYTGYHWTKACCETCGTMNANMGVSDYCFSKNVYWLYDCATAFTEQLDDVVTYEYADATYHKKIVDGGNYCEFCYGTRHTHSETLEPHDLHVDILPQIDNQRFAIVKHCHDCEYTSYDFVAAKAVVADYYGVVDGQAHTLVISDLSEAGVNAVIRYGNTAETCTMTAPPSYTEEGQYTVYYQITYSYQGVSMTENGVAYVWLRDESAPDLDDGTGCKCGCGKKDCDCEKGTCPNCKDKDCSKGDHNYILIETVRPTCDSLGYDRYICTICGMIEKRNYVNAIGHAWQFVLVREADCSNGGKVLDICRNCGTVKETATPKGEHSWTTYNVVATCTMPGYTVKECSKCGERQITNLTAVLGHNYKAYVTPATCVTGGKTVYVCDRCGDAYVGGYLGGNEQSTHEYVSKLLGKETIDTNTYGQSKGRNGNYSINYQLTGRELMTPDEVRMLDNRYALLFIRGERPVMDFKYDILKHPNVALTTDGKMPPFQHGEDTRSIAAISIDPQLLGEAVQIDTETHHYDILTSEELEDKIKELEEKQNEKDQQS